MNEGLYENDIIQCISKKLDLKKTVDTSQFLDRLNVIIKENGVCRTLLPFFKKNKYINIKNLKIILKNKVSILLLKRLGSGSYGKVYNIFYQNKYYSLKKNKNPSDVEEFILHIILYCLHKKLEESIGLVFHPPFPYIKKIFMIPREPVKTNINKLKNKKLRDCLKKNKLPDDDKDKKDKTIYAVKETLVCIMEKLDMTLNEFIKKVDSDNLILLVLIQVCYQLYCLQESIGFIHGDLNPGNIMLKKESFILDINIKDIHYSFKQEYRVYFIDLSFSSLNASKCKKCNLSNIELVNPFYYAYSGNMSHDLRILFAFMHNSTDYDKVDSLKTYCKDLFKGYNVSNAKRDATQFPHHFYREATFDENFFPLNMMINLQKLLL